MKKEAFLSLCGERDRKIILDGADSFEDILRMSWLSGVIYCMEVTIPLSMRLFQLFCAHPDGYDDVFCDGDEAVALQRVWFFQFLKNAPDERAAQEIRTYLRSWLNSI